MKRYPKLDHKQIALHAAGLGAAIHHLFENADPKVREKVANLHSGHIGIMEEAAAAAEQIEAWRAKCYHREFFNDEVLPFYYEVWDEIAREMWKGWVNGRTWGVAGDILNGMMLKGAKK